MYMRSTLLIGTTAMAALAILAVRVFPETSVALTVQPEDCPEPCVCLLKAANGSQVNSDPGGCLDVQVDTTGSESHSGCCEAPGCQADDCRVNLGKIRYQLEAPPPGNCDCSSIRVDGIDVNGVTFSVSGLAPGTWSPWFGSGSTAAGCGANDPNTGFAYKVDQVRCDSSDPMVLMIESETFYFCLDCDPTK
jgi:hypothetical protein